MQIQEQIMQELQYIPEAKLFELYDLIHYFRLGLTSEKAKQIAESEFKIDPQACLEAYEKIKKGDRSELIEIGNIDDYIENLSHEIIQD